MLCKCKRHSGTELVEVGWYVRYWGGAALLRRNRTWLVRYPAPTERVCLSRILNPLAWQPLASACEWVNASMCCKELWVVAILEKHYINTVHLPFTEGIGGIAKQVRSRGVEWLGLKWELVTGKNQAEWMNEWSARSHDTNLHAGCETRGGVGGVKMPLPGNVLKEKFNFK